MTAPDQPTPDEDTGAAYATSTNGPERIWLGPEWEEMQPEGRTWCQDNNWDEGAVPYIRADIAAQRPASDGWRLVPVDPTEEMINDNGVDSGPVTARRTWVAMLRAAPPAPFTDTDRGSAAEVERLRAERFLTAPIDERGYVDLSANAWQRRAETLLAEIGKAEARATAAEARVAAAVAVEREGCAQECDRLYEDDDDGDPDYASGLRACAEAIRARSAPASSDEVG